MGVVEPSRGKRALVLGDRSFGRDADGLTLRARFTAEIGNAIRDRHIQLVEMRPGVLLQLSDQSFPEQRVGGADF
jgi:hypothetical protein